MEVITNSDKETRKVAGLLAESIKEKPLKTKGALVIGFQGNLGSGKTTFIQGLAKGFKIKQYLTSPTFVLLKRYKVPNYKLLITNYKHLHHLDCYRLNKAKDLLELDFKEIINDNENIVLIEWAEKVRSILPKDTIWIKFKTISEKKRKITYGNSHK